MNDWYYRLFGSEFGPVTLEDLIELTKNCTLSGEDEIRFGEQGIWRRARSIGQLMAHIPFQAGKRVISVASNSVSSNQQHEQSGTTIEGFPASDEKDSTPEQEDSYWCLIEGKEYGPVGLKKIIEWVTSGRLHGDDRVKVGQAQYILAAQLPGLFPKRPLTRSVETKPEILKTTDTQNLSASRLRIEPISATPHSTVERSEERVAKPLNPTPVYAANSFHGTVNTRGPSVPVHRARIKKVSTASIADLLTGRPAIYVAGTLLLGAIAFIAVPYVSFGDSANVRRFKQLRGAYIELEKLRADDNVQPDTFQPLGEKIESVAKNVANEVKGSNDSGQRQLLALAKKLEKLSKEKLGMKPTESEDVVVKAIVETGKRLGVM